MHVCFLSILAVFFQSGVYKDDTDKNRFYRQTATLAEISDYSMQNTGFPSEIMLNSISYCEHSYNHFC